MKKMVSLIIVLVLAMSLATTAFALDGTGTVMDPYIVNSADDLVGFELTLEAGAAATFKVANAYSGATMVVEGGPSHLYSSFNQGVSNAEGVAEVVISGNPMWGYTVDIANESEHTQTYTLSIVVPLGSSGNPEELIIGDNAAAPSGSAGYDYYYTYTSEDAGVLTLSDIVVDTEIVDSYNIQISSDGFYNYSELLDENWQPKESVSFEMEAGETALIMVRVQDWDGAESTNISFAADFAIASGTANNPIVINMAGELASVDVAAGSETYYAVNSMLNGQILNIVGDENTTVTVNGTAVEAVDGVFSVELTGAPTNRVVVANAGDEDASYVAYINDAPGTENNPIVVEMSSQLTSADVDAGSETYYVISSMLNGQILTVKGDENTSVTVNGTAVEAVDGVFSVELTGAPTNRVVIANAGDEAASYEVSIAYVEENPGTGDFSVAGLVVAVMAATAGAVVISKKKEF